VVAQRGPAKKYTTAQAKNRVLDQVANGTRIVDAMRSVERSMGTWENWKRSDAEFKAKVDAIHAVRAENKKRGVEEGEDPRTLDFATWRKRFLGQDTFRHQQAWINLIESGEYTPVEGEFYQGSDPTRIIINVPPFHAKSMTVTVEYVTYRICMNPNIRVIIVSKKQEQAKKFLYAIKQRLTSNNWSALQATYAPEGGFRPERGEGATWGANMMYVAGVDSGEKDPTVEAIGIGGQIYGSRADLIILDDCVTLGNANEYEKQIQWLESEVENRVRDGKIILVGTRLATTDLYSELANGERYLAGRSPWTILRMPAVLQFADEPKDWVTLWPSTTSPMETGQKPNEDGTYDAWDGPRMARERDKKPPKVWSLVYQQQDVAEDAVFDPKCVLGSVDKRRKPGPLRAGAWGHPRHGLEGQYVIASMDPAMTGDTFTLVGAVDRKESVRRIMQAWVQPSPTPAYIRNLIESVTDEFSVNEWVIEQNAFQLFLVHDEGIQDFLRSRGVKLTPHYTGKNKQDPDFGVASVAPLFGSLRRMHDGAGRADHQGDNLIELPDPDLSQGVKTLIEELIQWQPGKLGKQLKMDGPMALWFFELRAREVLGIAKRRNRQFLDNPYLSRGDRERRIVVPMDSFRLASSE
jgi:hypothetical protein